MRRTGRARALLAMAACAVLAGCGIRPTGIISAGEGPRARAYAATITVYLVRGGGTAESGTLVAVTRPGLPGRPNLAVPQLSMPPTARERALGLHTEIHERLYADAAADGAGPTGHRSVLDVRASGPTRPATWSRTARAQIACTAQAIPGIERVNLWSRTDEERDEREILTCGQFSDLLD
ncbi:hypothetical protein BKA00_000506 [Actinomadura coerulea]|jgi:hypothetical protein|uniref:Lipoprotein n=1 Tax=Actinomadura coerulea TaxID=46159 RepID=A0A7X0FUV2_9ACTN|nr:hypothetical protein [Actinomadura coerulea]MBB6393592.1 hypothetical protein [Actinomadura coerulea]GGP91762.1 hypothetical protein GCM10010187_03940 [Actinomadura coerulea]